MGKSVDTDPVSARRAEGLKILHGVQAYLDRMQQIMEGKGDRKIVSFPDVAETLGPAIVWCMRFIAEDVDGAKCCRALESSGTPADKARRAWRHILKMQAVILWNTPPATMARLFPPVTAEAMSATRSEFPYWQDAAAFQKWILALENETMQGFCTALDRAGVSLNEWEGGCSMQP